MFNGKIILITGGTGSLGKKITEIISNNYSPEKLIIFSRDELKQFEMSQIWNEKKYPFIRYFIGDVRDRERLRRAFDGVDYVIHAAALKQVPAAEYNPSEAIKTNILGAMNVIDIAIDAGVKKVVALSTDKACNPINLYGATKLCSDKLFTAASVYSGFTGPTFSVVRYGNVSGSRGSVIPFFLEKSKTGILPITDLNMTRFFITIDHAAKFVLKVLEIGQGSEIFVPKIPSVKIVDLATAIAQNCEQKIIGVRSGEKIHEILISKDDARNTLECDDYYIILPQRLKETRRGVYNGAKNCLDNFEYSSDANEMIPQNELNNIVLTTIRENSGSEEGAVKN